MTQQNVSDVIVWLARMRDNTARAVELSEMLTADIFSEDIHEYWALVKYVENAQESAKQIDNINKKLFSELIEFDERYWKSLRGMRDRLVHKFWDIDPSILWNTVRVDFAEILALLSTMHVHERPVGEDDGFSFSHRPEKLFSLPDWSSETSFAAGHSIVAVAFTHFGNVKVIRVGHDGTLMKASVNVQGRLRVYGKPKSSGSKATSAPLI